MTDETAEEIKREKLEALQRRAAGGPDRPIEVEDKGHLDAVLDTHAVVLVDCYADWCGPCKQLKPIVARIAADTRAAVATVDIDRHPEMAREWQVRSVPTLLLFADGDPAERMMGIQPFDRLRELVARFDGN